MPYFIVNIIITILVLIFNTIGPGSFIQNKNNLIRKRILYFTFSAAFVLIIFMGFRNDFTADYGMYVNIFHDAYKESFIDLLLHRLSSGMIFHVERGYLILNKIIGLISENPFFFMTSIAAVLISLIYCEAINETTNIFWFTLLYFNVGTYLMGFNIMRNVLAASVTYFGTKFLRQGQYKNFIITILIAVSIHKSSVFMLIASPFLLWKVRARNIFVIIILTVFVTLFAEYIFLLFRNLLSYSYYKNLASGDGMGRFISMIIPWAMFLFGCLAVKMHKLEVNSIPDRILFNGALFCVIIITLSTKLGMVMLRARYFFSMYLMAFTANAIDAVFRGKKNFIFRLILFFMIFAYMYVRVNNVEAGYYNYVLLGEKVY